MITFCPVGRVLIAAWGEVAEESKPVGPRPATQFRNVERSLNRHREQCNICTPPPRTIRW